MGHTTVTASGKTCQAWSAQSPHSHGFDEDNMFPDGSAEAAQNYCRNPAEGFVGVWCYTTDPGVRYELCDVPVCGESTSCSAWASVEIWWGFHAKISNLFYKASPLQLSGTNRKVADSRRSGESILLLNLWLMLMLILRDFWSPLLISTVPFPSENAQPFFPFILSFISITVRSKYLLSLL